jgi:hypothetical protein
MKSGQPYSQSSTSKWAFTLLNQLFEIEKKLSSTENSDPSNCLRNVGKIKDALEEQGLFYEDPSGQPFNETRTDLDATISGTGTENLRVVEVIKPIIREGKRDLSRVSQKGIVVVESETPTKEEQL